jgi:hypothetical protein
VSIIPPIAKGPKGNPIGYTVALVAHTAGEGEKLEDFIASMMKLKGVKDPVFPFANRFSSGISYTIDDKSIYSDRGGAKIHFIGIERDAPQYPGLALEDQAEEINGTPGKLEFRTLSLVRNRFPGRIFYLLVLDTCEDIHAESWKAFQGLVNSMKLD